MPILTANVGPTARAQVDAVGKKAKLGNAETLRMLVVTGLGGSVKEWMDLNAEMAARREAAETTYGRKRAPGPREATSSGKQAPIITVRLPREWAKRVKEAGGLKEVVIKALDKLKVD